MRLWTLSLTFICFASLAWAEGDAVYLCRFQDESRDAYTIRMKKYYDATQEMNLGKVDLIKDAVLLETSPTRFLQIPMLDNQSYVQVWFSSSLILDAQLSYDQGFRPFHANFKRNSEKHELICSQLRP